MNTMDKQERLDRALRREPYMFRHVSDCQRIVDVAKGVGLHMSMGDAGRIWEWWSERMCAGWLIIDDDSEIIDAINHFIDE
jgi:hypothetical protein